MYNLPTTRNQLIMEVKFQDGTTAPIAKWSDTERGRELLTKRAIRAKAKDLTIIDYAIRAAEPTDNLKMIPDVLTAFGLV